MKEQITTTVTIEEADPITNLNRVLRLIKKKLDSPIGRRPIELEPVRLERLSKIIDSLGQDRPAKPLPIPDEYIDKWHEYLNGKKHNFTSRELSFLCWEPDVATNRMFLNLIRQPTFSIRARQIQGLVRSLHMRWSPDIFSTTVPDVIAELIKYYNGNNKIISRWRSNLSTICGINGPAELSENLLIARRPVKEFCDTWGIDESSAFTLDAIYKSIDRIVDSAKDDLTLIPHLFNNLLDWPNLPLTDFKRIISRIILHPINSIVPSFKEQLITFILSVKKKELGDPRLPDNKIKWQGVDSDAHQKFVQWMSKEDIVFFFEHVLPEREDKNKRKDFWIRYVNKLVQSRPLLSNEDRARLSQTTRQNNLFGSYGFMNGRNSSFILDFGDFVVIEFSQVGAVYVYSRDAAKTLFPDFWTSKPYTENSLKHKQKSLFILRHDPSWQHKMRCFLSKNGIKSD